MHPFACKSIGRIFIISPFARVLVSHWSGTVEIRRCFGAGEECVRSQAAGGQSPGARPVARCIRFTSQHDAIAYLRNFVLKPDEISRLRALLAEEIFHVHRLSDHQVAEKIAARLAQRDLCAIQWVSRTAPPTLVSSRRAAEYISSPQLSPAIPSPRVRTPVPPVPPEVNPLDEIDHDAQATTLEVASRNGVPFCEVCERARLNRNKTTQAS
jgi:hypothetical protein